MNSPASPPTPAAPLTEVALCRWIGAAAPGDAIIYHRGALARSLCPQLDVLEADARAALAKVARRAWMLSEGGLAHLVQRRRGPEDFEYLLIARPRPRRMAPNMLSRLLAEAA